MSKYTKESPFEFGIFTVWREENDSLNWRRSGFSTLSELAAALHAFIEAERIEQIESGMRMLRAIHESHGVPAESKGSAS